MGTTVGCRAQSSLVSLDALRKSVEEDPSGANFVIDLEAGPADDQPHVLVEYVVSDDVARHCLPLENFQDRLSSLQEGPFLRFMLAPTFQEVLNSPVIGRPQLGGR